MHKNDNQFAQARSRGLESNALGRVELVANMRNLEKLWFCS
jgi:hypothetical protein